MEAFRQKYEAKKVIVLKNIDAMTTKLIQLNDAKLTYISAGNETEDIYIKNRINIQIDIINAKLAVAGCQLETINAKLILFS